MDVEIDQSGFIAKTSVPTVLALSNKLRRAILIPAGVKGLCLKALRKRGLRGDSIYYRLFVSAIFLLVKDCLDEISRITIDIEFVGREAYLAGMLLSLIRKTVPTFSSEQIAFRRVGKSSPAHKLAIKTFRGEISPDKTIRAEELLRLIK